MTGAVGSLLLDWYGWQSVFYLSGSLTLLWVCYVHRYLLSEPGNRGRAGAASQRGFRGELGPPWPPNSRTWAGPGRLRGPRLRLGP